MIYLNKIKIAVFDFDGTLAVHKDKNYVQHRKGGHDYYIQILCVKIRAKIKKPL